MEPEDSEILLEQPAAETDKSSLQEKPTRTPIICTTCNKTFSSKGNLNKHYKEAHALHPVEDHCGTIHCLEQHCEFTSRYITDLRKHLVAIHGFKMDEEQVTFESLEGMEVSKNITS